jgi:hypothetical protein
MSTRAAASSKPAVLSRRAPVLPQPKEEEGGLFSGNRVVAIATIVVYTSAVFIAGYLTGTHTFLPCRRYPSPKAFELADAAASRSC